MKCGHCGTAVDSHVIDPDVPQAAYCSSDCARTDADNRPSTAMAAIFPEA